jgi:hypothetical protein
VDRSYPAYVNRPAIAVFRNPANTVTGDSWKFDCLPVG